MHTFHKLGRPCLLYAFVILHLLSFGATRHKSTISPLDTTEEHLKNSFLNYHKTYPQETIYIHTDQQIYTAGETIWFKVYSRCFGKTSSLSKIIYLQLADTAGKVVYHFKAPLVNGRAHGNIDISPKIKTGWYKLTGFTSWMMNFDHSLFFRKNIYISNPNDTIRKVESTSMTGFKIKFYPEGGDLIAGTDVKIAFKAVNIDGMPQQVHGIIKNNKDKNIIPFRSTHEGMGQFEIEAEPGVKYTAITYGANNIQNESSLPAVKESGISLSVNQDGKNINVKLAYTGPTSEFADCVLAATQNYGQIITYSLHLTKGINVFGVSQELFRTGIVRLTVFDKWGAPAAERVVFINKHDVQPSITMISQSLVADNSSSVLKLMLKNDQNQPLHSNLSVSVTDVQPENDKLPTDNIYSGLLLSPEIAGDVYDPGHYFINESDSLAQALDLVMLTSGWRHFIWQKMLSGEKPQINYPIEIDQKILGEIVDYKQFLNISKIPELNIMIVNQDSTKFIGKIIPDSSGKFKLDNFNHAGISSIYIEALRKGKYVEKVGAKIFKSLADSTRAFYADTLGFPPSPELSAKFLSAQKQWAFDELQTKGIVLGEVKVNGRKISPTTKLVKDHVSALYQTEKGYTLDLVNNPTLNMGFADYIRGRFPGLQVKGDGANVQFIYVAGGSTLQTLKPKDGLAAEMGGESSVPVPYFFLNETPVQFVDIKDLPLNDVALIRFVPPPVSFAPYNGGDVGAILIYTKVHADELSKTSNKSEFDHFLFEGYSVSREFESDMKVGLNGRKPEQNRLLIYWNHDIETSASGETELTLHRRLPGKIKVVIQGMDDEGNLIYKEAYFN